MKLFVTGAAGFIEFHTALGLLDRGDQVVGVDGTASIIAADRPHRTGRRS
jgi:UDP-glucuronate 4-epimerase